MTDFTAGLAGLYQFQDARRVAVCLDPLAESPAEHPRKGFFPWHSVGLFTAAAGFYRTRAGLAAARRRGVKLGPKFILAPASTALDHARKLITAGETVGEVAETIGVSRAILYRVLRRSQGIGQTA